MSLENFSKCPTCGSKLGIIESKPICKNCGYTIASFDSSHLDKKSNVYNDVLSISLEISKGYAVSRSFMHSIMKEKMSLGKTVLDLGSGKKASYENIVKAANVSDYFRADGNVENTPDVIVNFEETLPFENNSFDSILLMNVLEHVYDHKKLISEINRVLKPDGSLYFYVPFFIKIHGSPFDFYRYTENALFKLFHENTFTKVDIFTSGGFFKSFSEIFNWLSAIKIGYLLFPLYFILSSIDGLLDLLTKGSYSRSFPLGYFGICQKK